MIRSQVETDTFSDFKVGGHLAQLRRILVLSHTVLLCFACCLPAALASCSLCSLRACCMRVLVSLSAVVVSLFAFYL